MQKAFLIDRYKSADEISGLASGLAGLSDISVEAGPMLARKAHSSSAAFTLARDNFTWFGCRGGQ